MKTTEILLSLITIGVILVFPYMGLLPSFTYSIPILLLVWLALRLAKEKFSDIGFRFQDFSFKAFLVGALAAAATLAFMQLVFHPFLESIVSLEYSDSGLNEFIRESRFNLVLSIVFGWLIGGFYEEIVFHGFIFTRLEKMLPGESATPFSFIITALLFGVYHYVLGPSGMVNALLVGAVYLGLFLYFKRNLWYPIICHGVYNTLVMVLIYYGYF